MRWLQECAYKVPFRIFGEVSRFFSLSRLAMCFSRCLRSASKNLIETSSKSPKCSFVSTLLFLLCSAAALEAGTIRLINDSAYQLRAVVRANDGTYLGEVMINPQQTMTWTDLGKGVSYYSLSRTPYNVTWYCQEGADFSVNNTIATGATVSAMAGSGSRACQAKKNPNAAPSSEGHLQQQTEQSTQQAPSGGAAGPPGGRSVGPPTSG